MLQYNHIRNEVRKCELSIENKYSWIAKQKKVWYNIPVRGMNNGISERLERQAMGVHRTDIQTNDRKLRQSFKMEQAGFGECRIVPYLDGVK